MDALLLPSNEVVSWVFSMGDIDTLWLIYGWFYIPIFRSCSFGTPPPLHPPFVRVYVPIHQLRDFFIWIDFELMWVLVIYRSV